MSPRVSSLPQTMWTLATALCCGSVSRILCLCFFSLLQSVVVVCPVAVGRDVWNSHWLEIVRSCLKSAWKQIPPLFRNMVARAFLCDLGEESSVWWVGLILGRRKLSFFLLVLSPQKIAQEVSEHHLSQGRLYPPLSTIRDVSLRIAIKVRRTLLPTIWVVRLIHCLCEFRTEGVAGVETTWAPWAALHTAQRLSDKLLPAAPALPPTPTQASSGNDPDFPLKHQAGRPSSP